MKTLPPPTQEDTTTSGRYGYRRRLIRRDDFAHVIEPLIPLPGTDRVIPHAVIPQETIEKAARHCRNLGRSYEGEALGSSAKRVADMLLHPSTPLGTGELVLCAAALLCYEEAERCAAMADRDLDARLDCGPARLVANALENAVSDATRFVVQSCFDGDFVRGRR